MKIYILFFLQVCSFNYLYAQASPKIYASCDTFEIKGYVVFLTDFNKISNKYDTYYGFTYDSCVNNAKYLKHLFQKYVSKKSNQKEFGLLSNINEKEFNYIKSKINDALITSGIHGALIVNSICNSSKLKYIDSCLNIDLVGNKLFELPNSSSYCLKSKDNINPFKPMVSIRQMLLKCIIIKYESFEIYNETELNGEKTAKPPMSFCANPEKYKIDIKEIIASNKKDGYYYILSPIYRIN